MIGWQSLSLSLSLSRLMESIIQSIDITDILWTMGVCEVQFIDWIDADSLMDCTGASTSSLPYDERATLSGLV